MRIWFDVQALQGPFFERGIQRYVRSVAVELERRGAPIAGLGLNPSAGDVRPFHRDVLGSPHLRMASAEALRAAAVGGDLVYVCGSAFEGFRPIDNLWPNYRVIPEVPAYAIVYDTIPLRRPEEFQATHERRRFYAARRHLLEQADGYLAISQSAADDLRADVDIGTKPVTVIGCGVEPRFAPAEDPGAAWAIASAAVPAIEPAYLLYVGGFQPQKNVDRLLDAYARLPGELRTEHQLVIGGKVPDEQLAGWQRSCDRLGITGRVVFTGLIDDDALVALYQCARLMVFPSLYEGFGLPAAEAIACGTPALVADSSSLPEVIGWEPGMFDALDSGSIAALIERALTDASFDAALRAACAAAVPRHRWPAVVDRLLGALPGAPHPLGAPAPPRAAIIDDGRREGGAEPTPVNTEFGSGWRIDRYSPTPGRGEFPVRALGRVIEPALYDRTVRSAAAGASVGPG